MDLELERKYRYHVTLIDADWPVIQDWCYHYFGNFDDRWYKLGIDPLSNESIWYFKNKEDASFFVLKWL